ncbi:glycoside hydrolase family protein [Pseudomonas sp. 2835]|uniref:glycoside hydrolase family protein n=1 Tax=Pseudomonas sp. 2835 TaxID=3156451 RepID=UPI003D24F442
MPADCRRDTSLGQIWDTDGNCVSRSASANCASWLTTNQHDALISFTYNLGAANLESSA